MMDFIETASQAKENFFGTGLAADSTDDSKWAAEKLNLTPKDQTVSDFEGPLDSFLAEEAGAVTDIRSINHYKSA